MIDLDELIAEARRQVAHIEDKSVRERLIDRLADALEAATGRFECDRECIKERAPIEDCSAHGRTPRDLWGQIDEARKAAYTALNERDAALARIAEAAKLHRREVIAVHEGHGEEAWCPECEEHWPCPTAVALGLNEGEKDVS